MYCSLEYNLHDIAEKTSLSCFLLYPMSLQQSLTHVCNSLSLIYECVCVYTQTYTYIRIMSFLLVKWIIPQILLSSYYMTDNRPTLKPCELILFFLSVLKTCVHKESLVWFITVKSGVWPKTTIELIFFKICFWTMQKSYHLYYNKCAAWISVMPLPSHLPYAEREDIGDEGKFKP